ncbi:hypothetical protein AB4039_00505 [Streptomyces sp. M-16]|uniref:hypothetical protein n=1 Tax=Streptomyces sp. M-16 TaxID=3233040 RepID=UPI003F947090
MADTQDDPAAEPGPGGEWAFGTGPAADPAHWPPGSPLMEECIAKDGLTRPHCAPAPATSPTGTSMRETSLICRVSDGGSPPAG